MEVGGGGCRLLTGNLTTGCIEDAHRHLLTGLCSCVVDGQLTAMQRQAHAMGGNTAHGGSLGIAHHQLRESLEPVALVVAEVDGVVALRCRCLIIEGRPLDGHRSHVGVGIPDLIAFGQLRVETHLLVGTDVEQRRWHHPRGVAALTVGHYGLDGLHQVIVKEYIVQIAVERCFPVDSLTLDDAFVSNVGISAQGQHRLTLVAHIAIEMADVYVGRILFGLHTHA